MAAQTLATFDTKETADCVEACPIEGFETSLVVATYQLHKAADTDAASATDRRCGTLQHFHLEHDESDGGVSITKAEELETSSGIFDIKWSTHALEGKAVLASATAAGTLELYALTKDAGAPTHRIQHTGVSSEKDASSMCLSLDWSNRVIPNQEPAICVSHSDGCVSMLLRCVCFAVHVLIDVSLTMDTLYSALSVWNVSQSGVSASAKVGRSQRQCLRQTICLTLTASFSSEHAVASP